MSLRVFCVFLVVSIFVGCSSPTSSSPAIGTVDDQGGSDDAATSDADPVDPEPDVSAQDTSDEPDTQVQDVSGDDVDLADAAEDVQPTPDSTEPPPTDTTPESDIPVVKPRHHRSLATWSPSGTSHAHVGFRSTRRRTSCAAQPVRH